MSHPADAPAPPDLPAAFAAHRPRLRRMVELRLHPALASRVDPSDVLQDVYLDAMAQFPAYARSPRAGVYVWLRGLAWERLLKAHRRHFGADCRAVGREVALDPDASDGLAALLAGPAPDPPSEAARREARARVDEAIARLGDDDREVILLRDFEGLTNNEAAAILGVGPSAATMRYGRALHRLKALLTAPPVG